MNTSRRPTEDTSRGYWLALCGYTLWGVFPIYFYWVRHVSPLEVLSHRVVWSMLLLIGLTLVLTRNFRWSELARSPATLSICLASALLLSVNWLIFIWAVGNQMAVEASLGYFINPLVSVVLGVLFLNERLNRYQILAIMLACVGVLYLVIKAGEIPWVALSLAITFGAYGLIRKNSASTHLPG